jgi:hypothetical protein
VVPAKGQFIDLWHILIIGTAGWRVEGTQRVLVTAVKIIDNTLVEIQAKSTGGQRFICRRPIGVPRDGTCRYRDYFWNVESEKTANPHIYIESVVAYNLNRVLRTHVLDYVNHRVFQKSHGGFLQDVRPLGKHVRYDVHNDMCEYVHEHQKPTAAQCSEAA